MIIMIGIGLLFGVLMGDWNYSKLGKNFDSKNRGLVSMFTLKAFWFSLDIRFFKKSAFFRDSNI